MGTNNPRYACSNSACKAKITRNQLRGSNGICIYCKTPMNHTSWMGGQQATLAQLLTLPKAEEAEIEALAKRMIMPVSQLIGAAVTLQLKTWLDKSDEDIEKAVGQDLMLAKLYRR